MIVVKSLAVSHKGKVRAHNEDSVYADDQMGLWIVADGMGGHACGEVASQLAVDTVSAATENGKTLQQAITQAHQLILTQAQDNPEQKGMGTTVVAAQLLKTGFNLAWVGDSRLYLMTDKLQQLSTDHSFVQDMVCREVLSPEEAKIHPQKNLIIRSLGMKERRFNVDEVTVYPGLSGILFLASDGVSDYLPDQELQAIFKQSETLALTVANINEAVLKTEAADNFSFVLIEFKIDNRTKWLNKLKRNKCSLGFLSSPLAR